MAAIDGRVKNSGQALAPFGIDGILAAKTSGATDLNFRGERHRRCQFGDRLREKNDTCGH